MVWLTPKRSGCITDVSVVSTSPEQIESAMMKG